MHLCTLCSKRIRDHYFFIHICKGICDKLVSWKRTFLEYTLTQLFKHILLNTKITLNADDVFRNHDIIMHVQTIMGNGGVITVSQHDFGINHIATEKHFEHPSHWNYHVQEIKKYDF